MAVVPLDSGSIWAVTSVVKLCTPGGTIATDVGADAAASAAISGVFGGGGVCIVVGIFSLLPGVEGSVIFHKYFR